MNNIIAATSNVKLSVKVMSALVLLVLLPCLLSLININFAQSWKIHFFPAAIILASVFYGAGGDVYCAAGDSFIPDQHSLGGIDFFEH